MLRKINAFVGLALILLFLIHAIAGGYQMAGILAGGNQVLTVLAWIMVILAAVHILIGVILTVQTVRASKKSGKFYGKENAAFVVRRVSGFAMLIFLIAHIVIFYGNHSSGYRLNLFEGPQLVLSILLVVSLGVHILSNIRPLFISFGIDKAKRRTDVLIILVAILAFCVIMFVLYYYRWNIGWKWNIRIGE